MGNGILGMILGTANKVTDATIEQAGNAVNSARQYRYQTRLNTQGVENSKQLTDYNMTKNLEMWDKTNYEAQKAHMKGAGLNPALMYGMGGGGGTTANVAAGSSSGGSAPSNSNSQGNAGMSMNMAQMGLLKAQTENIQADTHNKEAQAGVAEVQKPNVEQDTHKKWQETHKMEMDNLIQEISQATDDKGNNTEGDIQRSAAVKQMRQQIEETAKRIELAKQQGMTQEAMQKKLGEETQLLKNQVDWEGLDITGDNVGKSIEKIIQMAVGTITGAKGIKSLKEVPKAKTQKK